MSSALSKRQQARNERTLQDLIKTVPGNDKCADCGARNPGATAKASPSHLTNAISIPSPRTEIRH
ncbi:Protein gts1 [Cryomyces antarcticus]|nr:Protein gts1 [Cryomyces antarcticus]